MRRLPLETYVEGLRQGRREILSQAITLVESSREDDRLLAQALLEALLPLSTRAIRIGVTGAPGVGKSTLIEDLGSFWVARGYRVAVLAIDPSSQNAGGSLLGDKTRMHELGRHPSAYVRPSPSRGALGGLGLRSFEAALLCEAAGFDRVLIESVGVGQSESDVVDISDLCLYLLAAGEGGDEVQAMKRGLSERIDLVVISKADEARRAAAAQTRRRLRSVYAQGLKDCPPIVLFHSGSANASEGLALEIQALWQRSDRAGALEERRRRQHRVWMWREINDQLHRRFREHPEVQKRLAATEKAVEGQEQTPWKAAHALLAFYEARAERLDEG